MEFQTDFKLAGPLAGLYGGITQAQNEEGKGLLNAYQSLKNQEQQYTSAEAQAKMQDPRYLQMKLENDMAKFGKDTEMSKLEQGYNSTTRALTDLKIAAAQGPQVLQQKALGYLQQMGIDPNSQQGKLMMQDPVGFAEKFQQFYAGAATQNADYQQKYGLQKQKDDASLLRTREEIAGRENVAGMNASASRYVADAGAANRDTNALILEEKNLRAAASQADTVIEKYKRGDMDAEIIASIRKQDPKKTLDQAKSEARTARDNYVKQLQIERDNNVAAANEYGTAVKGRLKLGQKPSSSTSELPPGVSVVTPK